MSKADFTAEDLILDPTFRNWVLGNDLEAKGYWEQFLHSHKGSAEEFEKAREILLHLSREEFELNDQDLDMGWENINSHIEHIDAQRKITKVVPMDSWTAIQQHKDSELKRRKSRLRRMLGVGSVFTVLVLGLILFNWLKHEPELPAPVEYVTHSNPAGVKSSVSLPDGSKITLNSASTIKFEKHFSSGIREIDLIGEAYFDVAKDSIRPFIVVTNDIQTKALGTSFNIKAFEGDSISVALVSGIVEVSNKDMSVDERLLPGEGLKTAGNNSQWEKNKFDIKETLAWMNKTLIFNKTPFEESLVKLENWYGVSFNLSGEMPPGLFISGKFEDETLSNILDGLSFSSRLNYTIEGSKVYLQFKP